jgi:toxin ParE1/3/4
VAEVRWSLTAELDLQAIERFIGRDSIIRATVFVDRLLQAAETLERTPRLGRVVPEFNRAELREIVYRDYRIVYLLDEGGVSVLRVVHGARDLRQLVQREPWDLN